MNLLPDMPQGPAHLPEIPEDVQKKYEQIKVKLEKLKKAILKDHKKHVIGLSLLPPKKDEKDKINVLTVINDAKAERQPDYRLKDKLTLDLVKIAKKVDEKIWLEIMLTSEISESCFDGKYEVPQLIAMGAPLHDPTDLLAAIKVSEVHKNMVIKRFEKYIVSYVAAGSIFRGEKSNDIDVFVIIDDTDVKRMSRVELKDKLRGLIQNMGFNAADLTGVKKQFHIQTYILTDFWESLKEAHPVMFTLLRDGVPLYDRGVFTPWRLLLKMGRIRPSPEAIDVQMDIGSRMVESAKNRLVNIVMLDLFYAVLNPAQAALMLYGIAPPTPKETVKLLQEVFVKREKILEQKYVDILENIRLKFKEIEHGKTKRVSGKEIDKMMDDTEIYLKRIKKLFDQIAKKKEKETMNRVYQECLNVTEDVIGKKPKSLVQEVKKYCADNKLSPRISEIIKDISKAKKDFDAGKLTKAEIDKCSREASTYIRLLVDHMQRKKHLELERVTIRFKHGEKVGEVILLDKTAIIIEDIAAKEKTFQKATIDKTGKLRDIKKASIEEFESLISKTQIPTVLTVKEQIFESLRNLLGKEIEIIL